MVAARPAASSLPARPRTLPSEAEQILGLDIKGHVVRRLLITPAADIAEEYYVSFLLDRANRTYLAMASVEGGMDIEEVARTKPEALAKIPVDASERCRRGQGARNRVRGQLSRRTSPSRWRRFWCSCGDVLIDEDATLVEVNPLVKAGDGQVLALDGKVTLDENADFRHPDHQSSSYTMRPTRSNLRRRRRTSTTSSSTARSASSATAPVW